MNRSERTGRWERFCVVGLGNHARTKLLPAIAANGQKVCSLVTSQSPTAWQGLPVFNQLADGLAGLGDGDAVIIATPPALHFRQCLEAAAAGVDVLVEKPAFITAEEAKRARAAATASGSIVVEAFMHRECKLYGRLMDIWQTERHRIRSIAATFQIPEMPSGTFRGGDDVAASALYDIGSYPVSLFGDLGLDLSRLSVLDARNLQDPLKTAIRLGGSDQDVTMTAVVGVAETYANRVELEFTDGETVTFEPFFFGRAGLRQVRTRGCGRSSDETVEEGDAFRAMLALPREARRRDAEETWDRLISATSHLERLGADLLSRRAG